MRLTLSEVVGQSEFGLVLRSGSDSALARAVAGAETVEADRPEELAAKDYILLTTGVRLRGNPELQRRLVVESESRGVAAIGFGVGLVFRSIPRPLLEEAQARDFPVFEVPFEIPFRDIIGFINRSYLSDDFYSLKRSVAVQNMLLGALGETRPEQELVERLATITGGPAVLFRPDGRVLAEAGGADAGAVWDAIARSSQPPGGFTVDALGVSVFPVLVQDGVRFWLSLPGAPSPLTRPVVEIAERVLRVFELARDVGVVEERVRRTELLNDLLDEHRAKEVSAERLEIFGFSAKGPWRVALVGGAPTAAEQAAALRALENAIVASGVPHLLGRHHDHLALILEGDGHLLESWTATLAGAGAEAHAALGRPVGSPAELVESRSDALLGLDFLQGVGAAPGRVMRFEDLGLVDALLSAADPAQLRARSRLVLEPLQEHQQLLETLVAYLDEDLNVNAAAARLHVHPNSLRYRLGRVEEILGQSVHELSTIVELYLALRAETRFRHR